MNEPLGGPVSPAPLAFPKRSTWVDVPGYEGFRLKVRTNYALHVGRALYSSDEMEFLEALRDVVLEHNGWLDENGDPFPPASDPAFWDALPNELAAVVVILAREAPSTLPNSLLRSRTRSAST